MERLPDHSGTGTEYHQTHNGNQRAGTAYDPLKTNRTQVKFPTLSARGKEIIQLISDGYTTQQIIETIHLSVNTIDNYRSNLLLKFGVTNTASLVKKAAQLGIVE